MQARLINSLILESGRHRLLPVQLLSVSADEVVDAAVGTGGQTAARAPERGHLLVSGVALALALKLQFDI